VIAELLQKLFMLTPDIADPASTCASGEPAGAALDATNFDGCSDNPH
jgi:hypothetical protein